VFERGCEALRGEGIDQKQRINPMQSNSVVSCKGFHCAQ
jgi:hypothetical protein